MLTVLHCDAQIYNEAVFDLLRAEPAPLGGRPALRLKEDAQGRVFVDGAQEASAECIIRHGTVTMSIHQQALSWRARSSGSCRAAPPWLSCLQPARRTQAMQLARQVRPWLFQVPVTTAEEALEALRRGSRARQKARTALNGASSRSHSIFTVAVDARQVSRGLLT